MNDIRSDQEESDIDYTEITNIYRFDRYPLSADCTSNDVLVGAYPPGIINLESRNRLSNSSLNALFFDTKQGDVKLDYTSSISLLEKISRRTGVQSPG